MNATKERYGADDLEALFEGASKVVVAKGKKVLEFDLKKDPPEPEDFQKAVLGPSGNLRAPTAKVGKTWVVGFSDDVYGPVFG